MNTLAKANEARVTNALNKLYSFNGEIMTLKAKLDRDAISFTSTEVPKYEYNRRKFNNMNHQEQAAYELKLQQTKIEYRANYANGTFITVPKMVFELYTS